MTDVIFPAHDLVSEPVLSFDPVDSDKQGLHPLRGLARFGPYSASVMNELLDPLRVAVVGPPGSRHKIAGLLQEIEQSHRPRERRAYLPEFPGMTRAFGVTPRLATDSALIELRHPIRQELESSDAPHTDLARALSDALVRLSSRRSEFDVAVVYLPVQWAAGFFDGPKRDFDLHDFVKATGAQLDIPTQVIGDGPQQAIAYRCRCSVAWRLSLALYTKAGGVPWKIATADNESAFIGISYAMRASAPRYVTCCSQVFDADGAGLEFVVYETEPALVRRDNPFLSREDMARVMARSLALYQRRHSGRTPRRLVVHKATEFRPDEVDGCFDALGRVDDLELLHVQGDTLWRGVEIEKKKTPGTYPCDRGTVLAIDARAILLWTQGNAPDVVDGRDYYKEGKGIPSPLLVRRFAGRGGWTETASAILGLSKMNWNNDGLYDRLPVTLSFASTLAKVIRHMPSLHAQPYNVRFFM